ncbi:MAG: hypothetical protein ACOCQ1_04400 [Halanaerobiaceae bacterium]
MRKLAGVWIGKVIELVRTGKWEIKFLRYNNQNDNYLEAVLSRINFDGKNLNKNIRGIVKCNLDTKQINYWIKSITNFKRKRKLIYSW